MATVERDPSLYRGCAEHYLVGRPPYSARLGDVIADELGLDGAATSSMSAADPECSPSSSPPGSITSSEYLSTSFAAPPLFGARLGAFLAEARALLETGTPTGRFWDWPGDTAVIIATKPS